MSPRYIILGSFEGETRYLNNCDGFSAQKSAARKLTHAQALLAIKRLWRDKRYDNKNVRMASL